jgi:hypothetical protein
MYKDEIISEVWENRKNFVEKYKHDIDAMIQELKSQQELSGRPVIDRRLPPSEAAQPDTQNTTLR